MTPVLRIDLEAFDHNLRRIRAVVAPANHLLVVKDDAYGHGVGPIVRRAFEQGVRWFGAFDVETAAAVRAEAGGSARIFAWMVATDDEIAAAIDLDLDLGVGDPGLLDEVARIARAAGARAKVHLKIDTGLHRNGIRPEEWDAALLRAREHQDDGVLEVVGVWSHLAEASDAEDDAAAAVFDAAVQSAVDAGFHIRLRHLSASAASFLRPVFRHDIVRVGAFAYGIRPSGGPDESELGVRPISTLSARVIAVEGDRVRIGIGALHGLPSSLAGRVAVGTPVGMRPLVGIGAMESTVERWREALVGDEVVIFGAGGPSATDLAEAIDTIGEEIAVRVSPLVGREWL